MKLFLLYRQFFDKEGESRKIGGIETYIEALGRLLLRIGIEPIICQYGNKYFETSWEGVKVLGFPVDKTNNFDNHKQLYSFVEKLINKKEDAVIFMTDIYSFKLNDVRNMSIQHGIAWDTPYFYGHPKANYLRRIRECYRAIKGFEQSPMSVCVDYNFYNWYKIMCPNNLPKQVFVIPNFCNKIIKKEELVRKLETIDDNNIKIIFARRFEEHRGSLLFAEVMNEFLKKHKNISLTIAGEGPCEGKMKEILKFHSNVVFTKYLGSQAYDIHKNHDIAVIPTIGSEGTSLSLLEAMGAGCLAVATPVGGMSNIVIDGYNGLFSMPDFESLYYTLEKAINLLTTNKQIIYNSVETIRTGFSIDAWESKWETIIKKLCSQKL